VQFIPTIVPAQSKRGDLKQRCLQGDESAWRDLYRDAFGLARAIALAPPFRFDSGTADDIAQETVVDLTMKLLEVDNWTGFTGRVAHNKCVDRVRKKKETPLTSYAKDAAAATRMVDALPAPEYLPESLDDNKALAFLRTALQSLGQPCRDMLHARFFDELSYEETAIRVSLPGKQIGVYLSRCLARLRKRIENAPLIRDELQALLGPRQ